MSKRRGRAVSVAEIMPVEYSVVRASAPNAAMNSCPRKKAGQTDARRIEACPGAGRFLGPVRGDCPRDNARQPGGDHDESDQRQVSGADRTDLGELGTDQRDHALRAAGPGESR